MIEYIHVLHSKSVLLFQTIFIAHGAGFEFNFLIHLSTEQVGKQIAWTS